VAYLVSDIAYNYTATKITSTQCDDHFNKLRFLEVLFPTIVKSLFRIMNRGPEAILLLVENVAGVGPMATLYGEKIETDHANRSNPIIQITEL